MLWYYVATMFVDSSSVTVNKKTYTRHLLRESFREGGKVKHRTIANISSCSQEEIDAIKLALKHKSNLAAIINVKDDLELLQGDSFGAVWVLFCVAKELGIFDALGKTRDGKLALWQVLARVIDQGSRLSATRLAASMTCCEVLGLKQFDEDDLYENLDWLHGKQSQVEDRLFQTAYGENRPCLYMYDVTSSYLEGQKNELGEFGYNRDKKSGKKQIVIGLLCDESGEPVSIEVFPGNTSDTKTFASQVHKVQNRFGGRSIIFVGDRGMIKGPQIDQLGESDFRYITAISKPEIETLLKTGVLQMSLFDEELYEIVTDAGVRYLLRRNPIRAEEMASSRNRRLFALQQDAIKYNQELAEHPRAKPEVRKRYLEAKADKLKISSLINITCDERSVSVVADSEKVADRARLDGCYVLKTDVLPAEASAKTIHSRYKDLAQVERAFRTCKTTFLNIRPIHLRLENRTKAHAFVVMLAYRIVRHLEQKWAEFNITVSEGISLLREWCVHEVKIPNGPSYLQIPTPRKKIQELVKVLGIAIPQAIPKSTAKVSTKKKLKRKP